MTNQNKVYAAATKIGETSYEVFGMWDFDLGHVVLKDRSERIDLAINNNAISSMVATGKENVAIGATWDGENFLLPNEMAIGWSFDAGIPKMSIEGKRSLFCFLDGNTVFFITSSIDETQHSDMFAAAFTNGAIMLDITDEPDVKEGSIWNGTNWINE